MNTKELREKNVDELEALKLEILREHFNLRMQKGSGQLSQKHLLRNARRNVARIETIITEKKNQDKAVIGGAS